jgi:hypothetical protein
MSFTFRKTFENSTSAAGVVDTGAKFSTGNNDIGTGVNDTDGK